MVYSKETAKRYGSQFTVIRCRFCKEEFDFWHNLGEHLSNEHEDEVEQAEVKDQHRKGHHTDFDQPSCPLCDGEDGGENSG